MSDNKIIENEDGFLVFPAKKGDYVLARRSEVAGGRPDEGNSSIIYLKSGPSIYVAAKMSEIGRALGAELANVRKGD